MQYATVNNALINPTLGVVFPGQGSQSVGMLAEIAASYPSIHTVFEEASAILEYDLWELVQQGPASVLDQTIHTQPALLTASYAIWQILESQGSLNPALLAGHSLGEYTALVCAGALSFTDAVRLVATRGRLMQEAVEVGKGAMAAIIGLEENIVQAICARVLSTTDGILSPANYNSVGQIVVAGHRAAVEQAIIFAKEAGAKLAVLLPISVPSHCALMQPAAMQLQIALESIAIQLPQIPVVNNIDAKPYDSVEAIRMGLVKQLYMPVRWVECMHYFIQAGIKTVIECGPGKILTGLNKRIDKHLQLMTTLDFFQNLE